MSDMIESCHYLTPSWRLQVHSLLLQSLSLGWTLAVCLIGPPIAVKHLKALMKAWVVMSSNCSMCNAQELMQVNITVYLFSSFLLSLTVNGPKQHSM